MVMVPSKVFLLALACSFARASAGVCCYSGGDDCDSSDDWCSKSEANCNECDGKIYAHTFSSGSPETQEFPGYRCCFGHNDCDSKRDWCSASSDKCSQCNGTLVAPNSTNASASAEAAAARPVVQVKQNTEHKTEKSAETKQKDDSSSSSWPFMLAGEATAAAGHCCYSGPKDCDDSRDWCSKSAARCTTCGGNFSNATADELAGATMLVGGSWQKYVPKQYRMKHSNSSSNNSNYDWKKYAHQYNNYDWKKYAHQNNSNNSNWEKYVPKEYRKQAKEDEKREEKQEKEEEAREKANASSPTMLYPHCNRVTPGTCHYLRCHSSRGPTTCISGKCICSIGYCAFGAGVCRAAAATALTELDAVNETARATWCQKENIEEGQRCNEAFKDELDRQADELKRKNARKADEQNRTEERREDEAKRKAEREADEKNHTAERKADEARRREQVAPASEFLAATQEDTGAVPLPSREQTAAVLAAGLSLMVFSRVWYGRRVTLPAAPLG